MDAMGLIGLTLGVLVVAGLVVLVRAGNRGTVREEDAARPRTVAELVQLRAAQRAAADSAVAQAVPIASAEPQPAPEPETPTQAESPAMGMPSNSSPPPDEHRPVVAELPTRLPDPEVITMGDCGPSPVSPPWNRVPDGSLILPAAAPEPPVEPAPVGPPAWRRPTAEGNPASRRAVATEHRSEPAVETTDAAAQADDELVGWTDWADVDADEDGARRDPPSSSGPPPSFGPGSPADASSSEAVAKLADHTPVENRPGGGAPAAPDPGRPSSTTANARVAVREDEHDEVDRALLRTLGFPDPNLRPGAAAVAFATPTVARRIDDTAVAAQPIRFRVVGRDAVPVPEATVTLLDGHGRETGTAVSDPDGGGVVEAPRPGGYVLVTSAPDHQPGAVAVTVDGAPLDVEVLLAGSGSLRGVVHTPSATPVVGARVTLLQDGEIVEITETGAAGGYRLADLAAGEYTLAVHTARYEPVTVVVQVSEGTAVEHDVTLSLGEPTTHPAGQRGEQSRAPGRTVSATDG